MSRREPSDPFEQHEAFDAVEMSTETDEEAAESAARNEAGSAAGESSAEPNLLERALKAAGSDAARYIPVRFVPALTSLVTTRLFTEGISKQDYGAFYLISAVTSLLAAGAVQWIQSSSIRFYWPARKAGRVDSYVSTVAWTALGSLLATAAVSGVALWLARGSIDAVVVRLIPAGVLYFIAHFYITAMLQVLRAANRAGAYAKLQVSVTLLVTVISIWLVSVQGWGAAGILAGAAVGNAIVAPFVLRQLGELGSLSPRGFDREMLSEYFSYGMPLVPSALASWALVVLDRFVIQYFRGPGEVGIYSVAYSLGDRIMQLVTMPLLLTMMPSIIEAFERRGQRLAEQVQTHFTRYFAMLTFPLLAGLAGASSVFMHVFTAEEYRVAYMVLPIVAAGSMFGSFSQVAGAGLGVHKRTKLIMMDVLIAAGFNVTVNVAFVPVFGYRFAALATVTSYFLLMGLMWWQSRPYMRWNIPWGALGRVLAAALVMGAAVAGLTLAFPPSLWLLLAEVAVGIAVYPTLLVLFGGLRPQERDFLVGLAKRGSDKLLRR